MPVLAHKEVPIIRLLTSDKSFEQSSIGAKVCLTQNNAMQNSGQNVAITNLVNLFVTGLWVSYSRG